MDFAEDYRDFISKNKIERECAAFFVEQARKDGYISIEEARAKGKKLKAGDKVYASAMGKIVALFQIGKKPLEGGMNILGAHIDSPRLDIKQNPLYEDEGLALLDTHYYGGIKKYQWVTIPLELHGVVALRNGESVSVRIGRDPGDPRFVIT
ncbi:MAG: aminopeptidase, partial [Treponema sp.]|nr:aminopeptidase [Treponema sp.]